MKKVIVLIMLTMFMIGCGGVQSEKDYDNKPLSYMMVESIEISGKICKYEIATNYLLHDFTLYTDCGKLNVGDEVTLTKVQK